MNIMVGSGWIYDLVTTEYRSGSVLLEDGRKDEDYRWWIETYNKQLLVKET